MTRGLKLLNWLDWLMLLVNFLVIWAVSLGVLTMLLPAAPVLPSSASGYIAMLLAPCLSGLNVLFEMRRRIRKRETALREARIAEGLECKCGYDLTGNVSGRCPECGAPVVDQSSQERSDSRATS